MNIVIREVHLGHVFAIFSSNEFLYPCSLMSIAHLKSFVDGAATFSEPPSTHVYMLPYVNLHIFVAAMVDCMHVGNLAEPLR